MDAGSALAPLLIALLAGLVVGVVTAVIVGLRMGLRGGRHLVESGLSQLGELPWSDIQGAVELGMRERGYSAMHNSREDSAPGAVDTLLSDGRQLHLMRLKHGSGLRVDEYTLFDLATRRDARQATRAWLVTTGMVPPATRKAAADAAIELIDDAQLWSLVRDHLSPRTRERIRNRQRSSLRSRIGLTIGLAALFGVMTFAAALHLQRALQTASVDVPAAALPAQPQVVDADAGPVPEPIITEPAPATPTPPAAAPSPAKPPPPLSEAQLLERRREAIRQVRELPGVIGASWNTASTLMVALPPDAALDNDDLFTQVCALLRDTEEIRRSRVQLELLGADPGKTRAARWRQCQ
ncbi:MAG: restriction endonuclease [Lysobacteraceae bacterium]